MRIKLMVVVFLGLFLSSITFAAEQPSDTYADRLSAATRYAQVTNIRKMMDDMIAGVSQQLPEKDRKEFADYMNANIDLPHFEKLHITLMTKHFTADELNALADFYGSPRGQAILSKFGPYMSDTTLIIQDEITRAIKRASATKPEKK